MENSEVLQLRGICKYFPGVNALQNVDFTLRSGEIHALMGENGAGKSTLIKVLTGVYVKDGGTILIRKNTSNDSEPEFEETHIKSPQDAQNS